MTLQAIHRQELLPYAETLGGYDRWAASYDRDGNPLLEATSWVLDRSPTGCSGGDVIELGCGTGRNALRLLGEGARSYTGIDGSLGMLGIAGALYRDPRVTFAHADLMWPQSTSRMFDIALVVLVLEHLPSLDVLCETLGRIVRPGGRVRILDLHPERVATGSLARFQDGATEVRFASFAHPVNAMAAALEATGFDVVRRDWLAGDAMVAAVPGLAGLRGLRVLVDLKATRRGAAR
jgi:SAM-dependent methyltransferase